MAANPDPGVTGTSILVVDDEEAIVRMVSMILERVGYSVTATTDCEKAMRRLEKGNFPLLITDLRMSPVDGRKLLQFARRTSPDTRVIIITAYASEQAEEEARGLGAVGYLTKPFRVDELLAAIKHALAAAPGSDAQK